MKNDYKVTQSTDLSSLSNGVNDLVKTGYEPIGGLLFVDGKYTQAMFKKVSTELSHSAPNEVKKISKEKD